MKTVILSGISGSGKTTFLRALEDVGFFCVDNFPLVLLEKFPELLQLTGSKISRCALVVDIREKDFFEDWKHLLIDAKLKHGAARCRDHTEQAKGKKCLQPRNDILVA